jgi:transcriptional regulator with XRE-family HTH domain
MKITADVVDTAVLSELGHRLGQARLGRNLAQADVAQNAGVSRLTVQRIESGQSITLISLIRILRALDLADGLDRLVPEPGPSPMARLDAAAPPRKRAPRRRRGPDGDRTAGWTWGDEKNRETP